MVKNSFSTTWKSSTQPRKQRKYNYNAPLHIKQNKMHTHLSLELRQKYGFRNVQLKKGDKVKVLRGNFAKKEGKVERIDLKREKVYVMGVENIKKDGSKQLLPLNASNLMIVALELTDKKRKAKLMSKSQPEKKSETKSAEAKK